MTRTELLLVGLKLCSSLCTMGIKTNSANTLTYTQYEDENNYMYYKHCACNTILSCRL